MAAKPRKSWVQKLHQPRDLPMVSRIQGKMSRRWGEGTVAIPSPLEVDAIMRKVSRGRLITINEIRSLVARKHGATIGCPITSGIFAWIAANAAEEERERGKVRITPYWRTLKSGSLLNPRYPGGEKRQRRLLEQEGHRVARKGKAWVVPDYERHLARIRLQDF